jgi:hypothetical protein
MPLCDRQLPSYKTFKLCLNNVGVIGTKLPHFPFFPLSLNTKTSQISINTNKTNKKVHGSFMDQVYLISLASCGLLDQEGQNTGDIKYIFGP